MLLKATRNFFVYGLILAAGLAVGRYLPLLVRMVTPNYQQGNFDAYYPDALTRVVVYGTATCPYCIRTRAYLTERHIPFVDLDVVKSEKGKREFTTLGGKGVPLILIGDRQMTGFDQAAIDAALEKMRPAPM